MRMSILYSLFRNLVPSFIPICQMIWTYLFNPIIRGASLQLPDIPTLLMPTPPSLSETIRRRIFIKLEGDTLSWAYD